MRNKRTAQNWGKGIWDTTVVYMTREKLKPGDVFQSFIFSLCSYQAVPHQFRKTLCGTAGNNVVSGNLIFTVVGGLLNGFVVCDRCVSQSGKGDDTRNE